MEAKGQENCNFWSKKWIKNFSFNFFPIYGHVMVMKPLDRIGVQPKMLDPESKNPDPKHCHKPLSGIRCGLFRIRILLYRSFRILHGILGQVNNWQKYLSVHKRTATRLLSFGKNEFAKIYNFLCLKSRISMEFFSSDPAFSAWRTCDSLKKVQVEKLSLNPVPVLNSQRWLT
jgi:hypothetical protein